MFNRHPEVEPSVIDGVEVPRMGTLIPYDPTTDRKFLGIYCPTPEWIGIDENLFTDEQKSAMVKQFQIPRIPKSNSCQ
jgi:hypothetical protein